ncbi:hypothetical protein GCM10023185_12180 [Hymenobacter saemangeumensis]|uniref:Magnesium citrate secondary transporter n=1 Tax=Hymenobacter saemangeumensis TaxID=1084522 RepID=A0ABP8I6M1_9BACT
MAGDRDSRLSWPRELRHPLFLGGAVLYGLLLLNRRVLHYYVPPLVRSYLADVLALPLILSLALAFMRRVYFRDARFCLPLSWVASTGLVLAVWFEGVLPWWRPGTTTADPWDAVAYALGGLLFWRWLNQPA